MTWTQTRAKIATAKRRDPDADVTALRTQLKAEKLAEHVERVVNSAPPLTADQLDRIRRLLHSAERVA